VPINKKPRPNDRGLSWSDAGVTDRDDSTRPARSVSHPRRDEECHSSFQILNKKKPDLTPSRPFFHRSGP
jgi:hypothetical protein